MATKKTRVAKKRSAAAIERKRQQTGASGVKGYAIVVDGGAKTIGASIRASVPEFAKI
jgi:hypothetical protein